MAARSRGPGMSGVPGVPSRDGDTGFPVFATAEAKCPAARRSRHSLRHPVRYVKHLLDLGVGGAVRPWDRRRTGSAGVGPASRP